MPLQIFDETHLLEKVLVWGEPGIEALLGQLLPKSRSLFFSYYETLEARREFFNMQRMIEKEGVEFIRAKDAFADVLAAKEIAGEPKSIVELEKVLLQRAGEYYDTFREYKSRDFSHESIHAGIEAVYEQIQSDIRAILSEDIDRYGELAALRMNFALSLQHEMPLANIFYGRDQSQVLTDKIALSSLKWKIRQPEVDIFKQALISLGFEDALVDVEHGTIEGGDIAMFGDTCYIGVGARTSLGAVKNLCKKIGRHLEERGIQIVAVVNKRHVDEAATYAAPTEEHMRIMHLDMFWIPLAADLVMAYGAEVDQREVLRISRNMDSFIVEDLGGFREYLTDKGIEILEVNDPEQKNFATNLLNLGNKTLIVALSKNARVIDELERRGFRVLSAELNKLVNGYGAVHCLTAPIFRKTI